MKFVFIACIHLLSQASAFHPDVAVSHTRSYDPAHAPATSLRFRVLTPSRTSHGISWRLAATAEYENKTKKRKDNDAMAFLRRRGLVGGTKDFTNAIGIDEGIAGKKGSTTLRKSNTAFKSCIESGVIDDYSQTFPFTSCGTEWSGFSDRVMGGISTGSVTREEVEGRPCNILRGKVSLYNNGGFIQMAAELSLDPSVSRYVDASRYDGIELEVFSQGDSPTENFNVHLKTPACTRFSAYRGTFQVRNNTGWQTIRLPWTEFKGNGEGAQKTPFDSSQLRRVGVVAIGREMDNVYLAVSKIGFYSAFSKDS